MLLTTDRLGSGRRSAKTRSIRSTSNRFRLMALDRLEERLLLSGPDLGITDTASSASYNVGDTIAYTLTVTNAPTADSVILPVPITVTDDVFSGLSNVTASAPSGWSISISSTTSPSTVTATYTGTFPIAAGAILPVITVTGTATQSSIMYPNQGSVTTLPGDMDEADKSAVVFVTVNSAPQPSDLTVSGSNGVYGGTANVSAVLSSGGSPVDGELVDFQLQGTELGTAITNASGIAEIDGVSLGSLDANFYSGSVTATFAGDASFVTSNGSAGLNVTPAALTITASDETKVYGTTTTFAGTEFTTTGLLFADTVTSATLTSPGAAATAVVAGSTYAINPSAAVGTGLSNYTITYNPGNLTVTTAPLTITASPESKTYGTTQTFAGTEFIATGLLNSDTVTSATLTSSGAAPTATVAGSPYLITPSAAAGTGLSNYTITYDTGNLTVDAASLTITANATSKTYGATTTFAGTEFTTSGLFNDDSVASVTLTSLGAAATATVAGSPYLITPGAAVGTGLSNYTITYDTGNLTVDAASLTITANDTTKTYGDTTTFAGTEFTTTGLVNSDSVASVTLTSPGAAATAVVAGSTYAINPSAAVGTGLSNYTITYDTGNLTVDAASLTITASDGTKVYGTTQTFAGNEFIATGLLNGDTVTSATLTSTGAAATASVAGSPYAIVPSEAVGTGLSNYTITYANGNLTVTQAPLTIVIDSLTKVYGQANPTFTGSVSGVLGDDDVVVNYTTTASQYSDVLVDGYPITVAGLSGKEAGDYSASIEGASVTNGVLTVTQAPLIITVNNQSIVYGQAIPTLTGNVTGVLNDDDVTVVYSTTAMQYSDVVAGGYMITATNATGAKALDYSPLVEGGSLTPGTLTVTPAPVTVLGANQTKVYGQVNPTLTGAITGLFNGDNVGAVYTTTATQFSDVNEGYPTAFLGLIGAKAGDYSTTITGGSTTPGTLAVTPAPLAITVNNQSQVYGQTTPALTGTLVGLVNGDDVTAQYATTATASSNVVAGGYPIVLTGVSGSKAADYTLVGSTAGTLTVTPAPLTVAAVNSTKLYGQADPTLTATYTGFVLGQNQSVLGGTLALNTQANAASHFGIYLITPSGLTSSNYSIQYAVAGIAVTPAPLMITAPSLVAVYGQAVTSLPPSYAGFVNGDTPANLIKTAIGFTTPKPVYNVGFYPTFAGGASSLDYAISYVPGIMDVIPAILTATPSSGFTVSGQPLPTFTVSYSGFVNGDTAASLTTPVTISTPATASSAPGFYPVISSGGSAANYVINHSYGILDVLAPAVPPLNPGQVAFVTSLYNNILGRAPEAGAVAAWINDLNQGVTRAAVAQDIYNSPEAVLFRATHRGHTINLATALTDAQQAQLHASQG